MNRNAHILFLMGVAFGAFGLSIGAEVRTTLIAAGLLAAAGVATVLFERRAATTPAAIAGAPVSRSTMQTKRLLMLLMAVGIIVYGGGAGTFATFSAETSNTNSQIASGTLTMSDAVTGGQTCFSSNGATNDNINDTPAQQTAASQANKNTTTQLGACDQILSLTNIAPGTFAGYNSVTIANTGSIDAQKFKMFAPYVNTALDDASGIAPSTNLATAYPTGITVLPLEGPVKNGDSIELDYGGSSYTATASADAAPLSTKLKLSGTTPAAVTFGNGTRITDTSTDGVNGLSQQENTDCFDVRNSVAQSVGATVGTGLNFNGTEHDATSHWVTDPTLTYTGPLCANLGLWIQEQSTVGGNTYNYCWYGDGATGSTHATVNGMCRAPISAAFSGTPPALPTGASTATLNLASGLRGNVVNGDGIKISELSKSAVTCTANADAYIGSTTLSVTNCSASAPTSPVGASFTTAAVITDTTTITDLSTDTHTIANFDTLHGANNQLELPTLVGNGSLATSGATVASVELGKAGSAGSASGTTGSAPASRKFFFGVYLQTNTATAQNAFQGLKTTFGIGWHLDQF